ncbi:HAD family hydrolase [Acholeplasma sp. OttesenSCG-928-E16]|nr:HAD family hydrolase [Acholeplasma sp. OttesenSCG-928-E16]
MIKGIIFDLDGTLLDTLDDIYNAVSHMLRIKKYPDKSKDDIKRALGYGAKYLISAVIPSGLSEIELADALRIYQEYYNEHQNDYSKPYEGVLEMLEKLKDQGYQLSIVSNKVDYMVKELNKNIFRGFIDEAVGETKGVPPKPDPTGVLNVMKKLNLKKEEVIYIGDTEVDIMTAKNCELFCVGCTWGFRDMDALLTAKADIIINHPLELLNVLNEGIKI